VSESFVDLTYRGLPLGRRIKLTQIRPSSGYLELPTPMPVGTAIAIATDEGVAIDAIVTQIYEQIGGSERSPGMVIAPALADAAAATWWQERVALPEPEPAPRSVVVLPRTRGSGTTPPPTPPLTPPLTPPALAPAAPAAAASEAAAPAAAASEAAAPAAAPPAPAAPAAAASEAVAPAAAAEGGPGPEREVGASEEDAPIEDDGKKTVMMESVDLSALGLEAGASGQLSASGIAAAVAAEGEADGGQGEGEAAGDADADAGEGEGEGDAEAAAAAPTDGEPRPADAPAEKKRLFGKKRKKRR